MQTLEQYVTKALQGDKTSLEEIVKEIQNLIYNLALRMLWHPEDAKDATQEILIKVITNLAKFENRSRFKTWVYRLASNELINYKGKFERQQINFDNFQSQLAEGQSESLTYTSNQAEQNLLVLEAKVGCSHAMLQCLNKEGRITYILGEILEFNSLEASEILNIKPEVFRKRLSRARKSIRHFVSGNCGLVNNKNSCKCYKKVDTNIKKQIIDPSNLLFVNSENKALIDSIESVQNEVALFQSNPEYKSPKDLYTQVINVITTSNF